ncbi:hypothetical protein [Stigmatella aurantiaca]|uniref:Lipoprotein n=1 Tax=Stigmatella aurantiaca (strain DW4/3-1) TaxID=378806 RepID=Q08PK0_STIAD|nr:hypothetical protein [Stigmatella aurantiaca]ADO71777.1 uncharacterized protein STAUR_3989 [Stigmatella aurantiaca DW4/3-1]EAU62408.1 hypothetical protein STIAU_0249 [Stigmatella aurantiaca DW4/3-1]
MKKLLAAGLLGLAALLGTGCSDACEKAGSALKDKYKECGIPYSDGDGNAETDTECTDEAADADKTLAECIEKASCDAMRDGTYTTEC